MTAPECIAPLGVEKDTLVGCGVLEYSSAAPRAPLMDFIALSKNR